MKQVVLVGLMGAGKSTTGRLVAERTGRTLVDTDVAITMRTGLTVRELWERDGEAGYRRMESDLVLDALDSDEGLVVAAPGGVVLDPRVRERLTPHLVVWLRADPATLAERVRPGDHRPLLGDDPRAVLSAMGTEREDLYLEVSDAVIDVGATAPDDVATQVIALLDP
jgi:shikimate kinase